MYFVTPIFLALVTILSSFYRAPSTKTFDFPLFQFEQFRQAFYFENHLYHFLNFAWFSNMCVHRYGPIRVISEYSIS